MSIEVYIAVNYLADLALLTAVSRALGRFRARRLLALSALTTLYAVAAASRPASWGTPCVQLALLALVSALLSSPPGGRQFSVNALWLGCAALLGGSVAALVPAVGPSAGLAGCLAAGLLITLMFGVTPPHEVKWQVCVCLRANGRCARFEALIDTGNRLREPLSGLPVLIAEAPLLRAILPEDGYRVLRYGAVGGTGRLACFRPGEVWIERGGIRRRAPDLWVAVAPERLPGLYRALAPSVFALYTV